MSFINYICICLHSYHNYALIHAVYSNNFPSEQQAPKLYNTVIFKLEYSNFVNEEGIAIINIKLGLF